MIEVESVGTRVGSVFTDMIACNSGLLISFCRYGSILFIPVSLLLNIVQGSRKSINACFLIFAARVKYHRLSGLNYRNLFLTVLESRNLRSGCQHGQIVERTLSLFVDRWPPTSCVLTKWKDRQSKLQSPPPLIRMVISS